MMDRQKSSFRDPHGYVYKEQDVVFRRVHQSYRHTYDRLIKSGLYKELVAAGLLIEHEEAKTSADPSVYKVLRPLRVPFISYPYEWSFSQLQDAAITTLKIQRRALQHGLILKDASAYNIQFHDGRPVLIDTLSFDTYTDGQPWYGYRQFCQHFLAPLALMSFVDPRLSQLLRVHIDGIPLDLTSKLLPRTSWLRTRILAHIHVHARTQQRFAAASQPTAMRSRWLSRRSQQQLANHLLKTVQSLPRKQQTTTWAHYYEDDSYTPIAFTDKQRLVKELIAKAQAQTVWDLGSNTGQFSLIAAQQCNLIVAFDADELTIEKQYRALRRQGIKNVLPLVLDLANPSPALGFAHQERDSLLARGPADLMLALALIHHLVITHHLPLKDIAEYFAQLGSRLIIEFVPTTDHKVQRLLATATRSFSEYSQTSFETAFNNFFTAEPPRKIQDSQRLLYFMTRK